MSVAYKTHAYYWEHPDLRPYMLNMPQGTVLFKQGEVGDDMFIVLNGKIELLAVANGKERPISLVGPGEFLGEQSLINQNSYQRAFTARTKTEVAALRLTAKQMGVLQKQSPQVAADILRGILTTAAQRLQKANQLIQLLRPSNNVQRLVSLILYFGEVASIQTESGKEVLLSPDSIRFYIDMSDFEIDECLMHLQKKLYLVKKAPNLYLIQDEKALRDSVPALKDCLPTIPVI